jgi:hypothetical protein
LKKEYLAAAAAAAAADSRSPSSFLIPVFV